MGIFSRFRDIVSSNLNALLDHAEDPEKMVRLMIQEMEDTLIEVKSSCAGVIADQKKIERALQEARDLADDWAEKATLAVNKGRDDLARAAISEKRRFVQKHDFLTEELERTKETVASFQSDIAQLEAKLVDAREKQRTLIQRRAAAVSRHNTATRIRRVDTSDAFVKFEAYENNIERMEADAELVDTFRPKETSLNQQFADLEGQEEIEEELREMKKAVGQNE
jgi:phage shock protein A